MKGLLAHYTSTIGEIAYHFSDDASAAARTGLVVALLLPFVHQAVGEGRLRLLMVYKKKYTTFHPTGVMSA